MKREILIATVLITNIAFAGPVSFTSRNTRDLLELDSNQKAQKTLFKSASSKLVARGLDEDIANKKVSDVLLHSEKANAFMTRTLLQHLTTLSYEDIVTHVANSALYGKSVDLRRYEDIVACVQSTPNHLLDETVVAKIAHVSQTNTKLMDMLA